MAQFSATMSSFTGIVGLLIESDEANNSAHQITLSPAVEPVFAIFAMMRKRTLIHFVNVSDG